MKLEDINQSLTILLFEGEEGDYVHRVQDVIWALQKKLETANPKDYKMAFTNKHFALSMTLGAKYTKGYQIKKFSKLKQGYEELQICSCINEFLIKWRKYTLEKLL